MLDNTEDLNRLNDLIAKAKRQGADAADAVLVHSIALSHARRLGETEKVEREESADLGLRVLVGKKQAIVSSTDLGPAALDELVSRAVSMARSVPEDPYTGLADPDQLCASIPELDMLDRDEPSSDTLIDRARQCEDAARSVPGVTNSEGAEASWSHRRLSLAGSNGFAGGYAVSGHSVGASVIAGEGTAMESEYDYSSAVYGADLEDAATIGRRAGERAVSRLNPRKTKTVQVPVVYDVRVAGGLLRHLIGAISGPAIARGTSFLKDKLGKKIFADGVTVIDDPLRRRGLRTRPFDGEGVATRATDIVRDGVLQTWLLDLASARQLGLETTGHASRGTSSPPSPSASNLHLQPGTQTLDELIADIDSGLYITSLMGMGVNGVTGDYSRGAAGFWIEKGEITYPVSEMTVAGNLSDMYLHMTPASDLEFRYGINSPTVRIEGLTVAGSA